MPRRAAVQIQDDIILATAILQAPGNAGKPMKGIHARKEELLIELKHCNDFKQRGRYESDLEFIERTRGVIAGLKAEGKSSKQMEKNLAELLVNLDKRKETQRQHALKWYNENKDQVKHYRKGYVKKRRVALTDYMRSYRERKRAEKTTTPSIHKKKKH